MRPEKGACSNLAADDLRDTLVAHVHHGCDFGHWKAVVVGGADRLIAL